MEGALGAHPVAPHPRVSQIPAEAFPSLVTPTLFPQRKQMEAELPPLLEKASQLCGQYNKLPFLEFKKR